jgi:hypothetical protein
MPDPAQGPISGAQGQAVGPGSASGQSEAAPNVSDGQTAGQGSATSQGQSPASQGTPSAEPTFFDPSTLPPELMTVYKQMQSAFTKKSQEISGHRQKIQAYDAFMVDPVTNLQNMAKQYGFQLTRAEAAAAVQSGQQGQQGQNWEPKSWDEVMDRATQAAMEKMRVQLQPLLQNVQKIHAQTVEEQLEKIDPNWRLYEDDMRANIATHPTLVNDVSKLYRLSVPDEVFASKHTQAALKKLEGTVSAARVEGKGKISSKTTATPQKISSFDDAVAEAKRLLASQGR